MRKPDLLILVVIWEFISAIMALIGIIAILMFAFPVVSEMMGIARTGGMFGLVIGLLVLFLKIGIAIGAALGILMDKEWGRILGIAHAAISLLAIPVGTIIGILVLMYLVKPEVRDWFLRAEPNQNP